jgi:guanylate kinase
MSNILFCITGPSGAGKTTVMRQCMTNEVGSITSRTTREGEVQGVDYLFVSKEEFKELIAFDELAEWTEYAGNYYGTTKDELQSKLENGHAYVICDNHGFKQFADVYDNVVSIFLYADEDDCVDNMFDRGDSTEKVNGRISTYDKEMANKGQYDYVVKNIRGYAHATIGVINNIIHAEMFRQLDKEAK